MIAPTYSLDVYIQNRFLITLTLLTIPRVGEQIFDSHKYMTVERVVYTTHANGTFDTIQLHCRIND